MNRVSSLLCLTAAAQNMLLQRATAPLLVPKLKYHSISRSLWLARRFPFGSEKNSRGAPRGVPLRCMSKGGGTKGEGGGRDEDRLDEIDFEELERRAANFEEELQSHGIPHEVVDPGGASPDFDRIDAEAIKRFDRRGGGEGEGEEGPVVLASFRGESGEYDTSELLEQVKSDAASLLIAADCKDTELSLTLCDDPTIQGYNKEYRSVDRPTDVLSFPMNDEYVLGDLIISVQTAHQQAEERGYALRDEIRILLVHGLLHLLGYDHDLSQEDWIEMADAERRLIDRLEWKGSGLIDLADTTP